MGRDPSAERSDVLRSVLSDRRADEVWSLVTRRDRAEAVLPMR
jgi:hypothetical protein